jgi:hypothetical protein
MSTGVHSVENNLLDYFFIHYNRKMPEETNWKTRCAKELSQAELAREKGNEGMARVCARRAAGHVLRAYFESQGVQPPALGAYQLLLFLTTAEGVSGQTREVAQQFTVPITHDHELPVDADLIANVYWLAWELLGESLA